MTTIIDGRAIGERMRAALRVRIARLKTKPGLAIVQVGDHPESTLYVQLKERAARELGMEFEKHLLSSAATAEEVCRTIEKLNANRNVHGIVVQLPLPDHLETQKILSAVSLEKDVDGLHPLFQQTVQRGKKTFWLPALQKSICALLDDGKTPYKGKTALLLAKSEEFRATLGAVLKRRGCRVAGASSKEGAKALGQADIVVTALGIPGVLRDDELRPGSVLIDVGLIQKPGGGVTGDFLQPGAASHVAAYSPVPGGIGPVTVASLLENTVIACEKQTKRSLLSLRIQPTTLLWVLPVLAISIASFFFGGADYRGKAILFFALAIATCLLWFIGPRRVAGPWWKNPSVWFGVLLLIAAVSCLLSPVPRKSYEEFSLLVLSFLAFHCGIAVPEKSRKASAWVFVLGGVALACWSIWMLLIQTEGQVRLFGPLKNADGLGPALILPLALAVGLLQGAQGRWSRILSSTTILLLGTAIVLTSSVSAIAGIAVASTIAVIFLRPRISRAAIGVGVMLVLIVGSAIAIRGSITHSFQQADSLTGITAGGASGSFDQRISFLRSTFAMVADHPLLGTGLNTWAEYFPRYQRSLRERSELAHGTATQYAGEMGIVGVVAFLFTFGAVLLALLGAARRRSLLAPSSFTGLLALALASMVDISWFYPAVLCSFWFFSGTYLHTESVEMSTKRLIRGYRTGMTLLALLLLFYGFTRMVTSYFVDAADRSGAKKKDFIDTIASAELAMRVLPTPSEELRMTILLYTNGWSPPDRAEAKAWAERTLRHNPWQPATYLLLGRIAKDEKDNARAEEYFRDGLEKDPHFVPDLAVELAALYLEAGRYAETRDLASAQLHRTGADVPGGLRSLSRLATTKARAELALGEKESAHSSILLALDHNPANETAKKLLKDEFNETR